MKVFVLITLTAIGVSNASSMMGMMMQSDNQQMRGDMYPRDQRPDDRNMMNGDMRQDDERRRMDDEYDDRRQMDDDERRRDEPMRPPRVWTIGIGRDWAPLEMLDRERMVVVGLGVDMMRAACTWANERCEFVYYRNYSDCWHRENGFSPALAYRWFDACANFNPTFERRLVNAFTRSYTREPPSGLYVRINDNLRIEDIMRSSNEITFGFIRGSMLNEECLRQNDIMVNEGRMRMYDSMDQLREALRSGQVRVAFTVRHDADERLFQMMEMGDWRIQCGMGGASVMTRKDNHEFLQWMNRAIEHVMRSDAYRRMCYVWEEILDRETYCMEMNEMDGERMGDGWMMGDDRNGPPMTPRDGPPSPPM